MGAGGAVTFLNLFGGGGIRFWLAELSDSDSPVAAVVEESTVPSADWLVVLGSYSKQQRMQAEPLVDRLDDAGYKADRANRTMEDPSVADTPDRRDRLRIQDSDLHPTLRNRYRVVLMGPYQKAHAEAVARDLDERLKLGASIKSGVQ